MALIRHSNTGQYFRQAPIKTFCTAQMELFESAYFVCLDPLTPTLCHRHWNLMEFKLSLL